MVMGFNDYGAIGKIVHTTKYSSPIQIPGTTWKDGCGSVEILHCGATENNTINT